MNEVRIISGKWGRRKLAFPSRAQLRPTPDRTRETLFNWLAPTIADARCLDLFAGSGALGFEAASRGAQQCVLVERDPVVARALVASRDLLGAQQCDIVRADALMYLAGTEQIFDVVFLDPPFDTSLVSECLGLLIARELLAMDARVYVEYRTTAHPDFGAFEVAKSTRAGDSSAALLALRSGQQP